jgi:WD40 repeat protein
MSDADPRDGIVRIINQRGDTTGSGFLLTSDGLVATCAHVVAADGTGPGDMVTVEFLRAGARGPARVEPGMWRGTDREDVALLRWTSDLPDGVVPLPLRRAAGSAGNRFMTYGFPEVTGGRGMWGYGLIGHLVVDASGIEVLQLTGTTEASPGFSGGPVIDQTSNRVVGMVSSITRADRYGRLVETAFATTADTLRRIHPPLAMSDVCPYRSLDYFAEEHAPYFFGRGGVVDRLLAGLQAQPRFLAILGPSGSGKSSLLRAGLSARLHAGALPGSEDWDVRALRPHDLLRMMDTAMSAAARAVLLVDQFEETFAMSSAEQLRVGEALRRLLGSPDAFSVVLAMRDDFYSHLAGAFPDLMEEWVAPNLVNVPAVLSELELTEIIAGPANKVGLRLEAGLVDAIIDDVVSATQVDDGSASTQHGVTGRRTARSSVLPLLEFALTQLWQNHDDGLMRRGAYRAMGGLGGAIARWADSVYFGMSEADRPVVQRVLVGLSYLGDETAGTPTSRRHRFLDELQGESRRADVADVLGRLVTSRLLVTRRDDATGRVVVELVHDALLSEWRLLRDWLRRDRDFLMWMQELGSRMRTWSASSSHGEGDDADWLRGRELDRALQWLQSRGDDIGLPQRAFIEGSRIARERHLLRERRLQEVAEQSRREVERQRQIAHTREFVARLRSDTEEAVALLETTPAQGLALAIATAGRNVAELGDEPLAFVQVGLHAAVRAAKERRVLAGHASAITATAADKTMQLLASCSLDRTVRLWRLGTYDRPDRGLIIHDGEQHFTALALDPPGQNLAAGDANGVIRLWTAEGAAGPVWPGHGDAVLALAFVPSDRLLVSAGADGRVAAWSLDRADQVAEKTFPGYVSAIAVEMAPGTAVLTGHSDGAVRRWSIGRQDSDEEICRHPAFVTAVAIGPDAIASGGGDGSVLLTPRTTMDLPARPILAGMHDGFVRAVAFAANGTALVSAGEDGTVRIWDSSGHSIHRPLMAYGQAVTSVTVSDNGRHIAGGCGDGTVRLWDWLPAELPPPASTAPSSAGGSTAPRTEDSPPPRWDPNGDQAAPAWVGHRDGVLAVAFTHDGRRVVSASWDREIRIWSLDGAVECTIVDPHDGASLTSVACSPGGFPVIASGGRDNMVRLWDLSGRPVGRPMTGHTADVMAVAFSPDGSLIATASRDLTVRLWRLDGSACGEPLRGHRENVVSVAFSPDGESVASGSRDGTVRVWRLDGTPIGEPKAGHGSYVWDVAFSPDGLSLAIGGDDRAVWVRDVAGTNARAWRGHTADVRAVAWSPVGQLLASGGADGTVRLWDPRAGGVARPLRGHRGAVLSLAVARDGRYAVTGGDDYTVRLWRLGSWRTWVSEGLDRLRDHPLLAADAELARAVLAAGTAADVSSTSTTGRLS